MALARIVATLAGLAADVAKEYKEVDGQFVLDITGDDLSPLVNAKAREKEEHQKTKEKLTKAENDLLEMRRGAVSKDDLAAIEESYKTKATEADTKHKEDLKTLNRRLDAATRTAAAIKIANELSDSPALMLPYITKRLSVEFGEDGDEAIIRVKGADGKPSALTLDDLKKELVANADLAAIIRGSKGTGSAHTTGQQPKPSDTSGAGKALKDMNDIERTEFWKRDPEGFKKAVAEQNAS